jgi:hypothetical protein
MAHAKQGTNIIFTQIVEHRSQHPTKNCADTPGHEESYSAHDTLVFLNDEFVRISRDALRVAWTHILMHARPSGMNIYDWFTSYNALKRECTSSRSVANQGKPFSSKKQKRTNKLTVRQITEFEKTKIQSISSTKFTVSSLERITFKTEGLLKPLSKHHDKFTQKHTTTAVIKKCLEAREKEHCPPSLRLKRQSQRNNVRAHHHHEQGNTILTISLMKQSVPHQTDPWHGYNFEPSTCWNESFDYDYDYRSY